MSAEIVGNKLFLDGFVFYHSKILGERRHWECKRLRIGKECSVRATTNNPRASEQLVVIKHPTVTSYSHPPNFNECEAEKVKFSLKRKAEAHPEQPPAQLLRTELASTSEGTVDSNCTGIFA